MGCARLPLALAVVAARAAVDPKSTLDSLAAQLDGGRGRLDTLTGDDTASDMRAVFSWSDDALTPGAAAVFRLIGLHPGPDVSLSAVASLAGLTTDVTRSHVHELVDAHLVEHQVPDRHTMHDLLRAYASEQAQTLDRRAATRRMLDHYLHTALAAARLVSTQETDAGTGPVSGAVVERFAGLDQAMAWYTTEHAVLLAVIHHATATGWHEHTWRLAAAVGAFLDLRGLWHDQLAVQHAAVAAAQRLGDPDAEERAHGSLGATCVRLSLYDEAHTHLQHALDLASRAGDPHRQAHAQLGPSYLWERRGDHAEALGHARKAHTLLRAAGHRAGEATALNAIGWHLAQLGDHEQAIVYCGQALDLHRELGNRPGQANAWDSLGFAHHHLGHHTDAVTCYRHAVQLHRETGNRYYEAEVLTHLGDTHHDGRGGSVEFRVLGGLAIRAAGQLLALGAPKQRTLTALLLVRTNAVVPLPWVGWRSSTPGSRRFTGRFGRVEPRWQVRSFLHGLLSDVDSRSCWQLAEQAEDASPHAMQRLLGEAVWDAGAVRDDVRGRRRSPRRDGRLCRFLAHRSGVGQQEVMDQASSDGRSHSVWVHCARRCVY